MKQKRANIHDLYAQDNLSTEQAQRLSQEIIFGPIIFQVSRLMVKFGLFEFLSSEHKHGKTFAEIVNHTKLSEYAVTVLLEASLTARTINYQNNKYSLSNVGWFLINDKMAEVNMNFNHDVNYQGMFYLEEALLNAKPAGLKVLGDWDTIYQGLSKLSPQVQKSWFEFDHLYSDNAFEEALAIVFADNKIDKLLDVGGNTGKWAAKCVDYCDSVEVTIMDLPGQLQIMKQKCQGKNGCNRIHAHGINLLDTTVPFPNGFDAIWMSQFLDCFSNDEVISILSRAADSMNTDGKLYIMESIWDRQKYDTAAYCLTQISVYFTAMANGNSKLFNSNDLKKCIISSGLKIEQIHDNIGLGHTLLVCSLA